jgi:hypothetical protein
LGAARDAFKDKGDKASQNDYSRDTASWDDYALKTAGIAPGLRFTWSDCFSAVEVKRTKPKPPPSRKYAVKDVNVILPIYETVQDRPAQGKSAQSSEKEMSNPSKDAAPVLRKSQLAISYQFYRPFSTRATSSVEAYRFTVQYISQLTAQRSSLQPFHDFHHFFAHLVRF